MNITEKDVGRVAVDGAGMRWTIIHIADGETFPVTARNGKYAETFRLDGSKLDHTDSLSLIRFSDEPDAKPPETECQVGFDEYGWPFVEIDNMPRLDLAGQTFTYRWEGK